MRSAGLLNSILAATLATPLLGQVYTPPPQQTTPAETNPSSAQQQQTATSPFGQEVPLLDPAAETVTVAGITIPLGNSRVIKARFEKYLNQPAENSEAASAYRADITEILTVLAPHNFASISGKQQKGNPLVDAFRLLPRAASYPGDAGLSSSLAESIYTAMLARQDSNNLREINNRLAEERRQASIEGDRVARNERANGLGRKERVTESNNGDVTTETITPGVGEQSLRYTDHLRRITEIEALRKTNIIRSEAALIQSKVQYQTAMVQWFLQRRFQHVLMASRFYNRIWTDGDRTLKFEKDSDVSRLFSESLGSTPTVSTLDSLASEAIRDSEKAIESFNYLLEKNEIHSASQRLMEAFALGEYLEPVTTLPREKKRQVQDHITNLNLLYEAMQGRDYTTAQDLLTKLQSSARDFPAAKATSAITGFTLASDLALEEAKSHLLSQNREAAVAASKEAADIWPTNPKLNEFRELASNISTPVVARNDFDRLLAEKNYREIARRTETGEFPTALRGDTKRQAALKQITGNLRTIEVAISKANEFTKQGNSYGAYEQLARIRQEFPDDPKLGREIEILAPKVADFTLALNRAQELRERRKPQLASALAHYLEAQSIYPNSEIAEENIEELIELLLP